MTRRITLILKLIVSLAFIVLILSRLDLAEIGRAITRARLATILVSLGLAFIAYIGRAERWRSILAYGGIGMSRRSAYRLTLVGVGYGIVTPGKVGEIGKALHLDQPAARAIPSVLWERLWDLILLELACVPAFLLYSIGHPAILAGYGLIVLLTLLLILAINSRNIAEMIQRLVPRLENAIETWKGAAPGALSSRSTGPALIGTLWFYGANFLGAYLIARDLSPDHAGMLFPMFPLIILLGNLPVAFGGIGLREYVAALVVSIVGGNPEVGPALSLLWFLVVTVLPGLVGMTTLLFTSGTKTSKESV